jgi:hypothetical protein
MMERILRNIVGAGAMALLALVASTASAQPRYGLASEPYAAFSKWMTSNCFGEEARALESELRRFRAALVPAFQKAIADGPPAAEVRGVRAAAEARHAELAKMRLQDYRIEGLTPQVAARASVPATRQSYVADQVRRYSNGYRANAVSGLAILGGPEARATLTRLARRDDALAPAAREALNTMDR